MSVDNVPAFALYDFCPALEPSRASPLMFWNGATRWVATQLNAVCTYFPAPPREENDPKRKILLVHCHPRRDSFGSALADAVEAGAKDGGHEIRRRGLYEAKFQPVMSAAENAAYMDTRKGISRMPRDIQQAIQDLRWCDSLVVVYPTWWFGMPAMLKVRFMPSSDSPPPVESRIRPVEHGMV